MRELTCISVKNPLSYLICAGIKDVENRTWQTKHRGWIYIHSCGDLEFPLISVKDLPKEFHGEVTETTELYSDAILKLDKFIKQYYGIQKDDPEKIKKVVDEKGCFFKSRCIVGRVKLVDIVRNSESPFAQKGFYHWILKDAELFKDPIDNILGRQSIFQITV